MTEDAPEAEDDIDPQAETEEYRQLAQESFKAGDVNDAAAYYQMVLDLSPTAQDHTSLGVVLASRGEWQAAIEQCESAIALEPSLGNPYNDMGVYLAELGRHEEALESLDKAIAAEHYDCRHYPHFHRGRILEQLARFGEARDAFQQSLTIEPDWEPAQIALCHVLGWLN